VTTLVSGLAYPECPRWHDGALWLSDQHDGTVLRISPSGATEVVVTVPGGPAGLGWTTDGTLLVVSMHDHALLTFDGSDLRTVADLSGFHPGLSNDMVIDEAGRAYIGNIGFDFYAGEEPRTTVLAMVEDGRVSVAADGLLVPNGMVIDGPVLVVAESFAHRLTAYDRAADGQLSGRRVFADLGEEIPDGICLDAEGAVWYAAIARGEVVRVLPGGQVTDRVKVDAAEAVACVLGGEHGKTLYVCTTDELQPERSKEARSGRVEAVEVAVPAPAVAA
jgi:sugar lactone lactonase YvrE